MLITFGVLGAAAVILAALAGSIIARSALSPIQRLNAETRRVTETLDHSRRLGQQGAQELQVLAASFNREAVQRAERRAPTVRFELDAEPAVIVNSPDRVDRAISNVIDNARKWGAEGGTIEVSLHDGVLTVRDHGPGFNPADLEHIFERFYRSDQARRMPGSGLGLAIVKQAAEAHGGYARATNAPDGGAVLQSPSAALTLRLASPASDQSRFAENLAAQLPRCA